MKGLLSVTVAFKSLGEKPIVHTISRAVVLPLDTDEQNTHPSCRRCNRSMHGNLQLYALYLQRTYGVEILEELERAKRTIVKNFPYQELIDFYAGELRKMP